MHETGMDVFDCTAMVEHEPRMANLKRALEQLALWLVSERIAPFNFFAEVDEDGDGLSFGFAVDDAYRENFAEVEMEFWEYVGSLIPLKVEFLSWLHSPRFEPEATIDQFNGYFRLPISPDLTSVAYRFPPQEFWTKRCELEELEYAIELARSHSKRRNRPVKLIASDGRRLDSPS